MSASTLSPVRAALLLIALASIWSSSFSVIKVGVETLPPITLAALRITLAAVLLYAYVRWQSGTIPTSKKFWALAFVVGLFGNGLPFSLIGWGEQTIDSGLAAILMAVMPLATLLLAHLFAPGERISGLKLLGIVVGFSGVVVLIGPEALKGLGGDALRQMAVAGGALCYAIASTTATRMPRLHPAESGAAMMIAAALQMIPLSLYFDRPWTLQPSTESLMAAVYLGLFPTALAAIIYFFLIRERGATFIALNNYMIPALGVFWGWLFLDELISAQALLALAFILTGIAISNARPMRR